MTNENIEVADEVTSDSPIVSTRTYETADGTYKEFVDAKGITVTQYAPSAEVVAQQAADQEAARLAQPVPADERMSASADALERGDMKLAAALMRPSTRAEFDALTA